MTLAETWTARRRTVTAMAMLCLASLIVTFVPFRLWRHRLGPGRGAQDDLPKAKLLAAHVERATRRLPFATKCLAQAMVLSWQLRRAGIDHRLVIAARPPGARGGGEDLHAWIAIGDVIALGARPGPWIPVLELPKH